MPFLGEGATANVVAVAFNVSPLLGGGGVGVSPYRVVTLIDDSTGAHTYVQLVLWGEFAEGPGMQLHEKLEGPPVAGQVMSSAVVVIVALGAVVSGGGLALYPGGHSRLITRGEAGICPGPRRCARDSSAGVGGRAPGGGVGAGAGAAAAPLSASRIRGAPPGGPSGDKHRSVVLVASPKLFF